MGGGSGGYFLCFVFEQGVIAGLWVRSNKVSISLFLSGDTMCYV